MNSDPAVLAPHVEKAWRDAFVIELRLRAVHGSGIGDALAEVESHVVDAATSAGDAFGDPTQYAALVAETTGRLEPPRLRDVALVALGATSVVLALDGVVQWVGDGTVELTGATVVLVATMAAMPLVLRRHGAAILRYGFTGPAWRLGLVSAAFVGSVVGLALLVRPWQLTTLPAAPVTVGALVLAAVGLVLGVRGRTDPLLAPGTGRADAAAAARHDARRATLVIAGTQLGILAAAGVTAFLVARLAG